MHVGGVVFCLLNMFLYKTILINYFLWSIMIIKFQRVVPEFTFHVLNGRLPDTQILELPFEILFSRSYLKCGVVRFYWRN